METPEAIIRSISEQQHGIVTSSQILAAGMSEKAIRGRIKRGAWRRIDRGVYILFGPDSAEARLAAAVSALPAVVSHGSAAVNQGLIDEPPSLPEVTIPHRFSNRFPGVSVHESTDLDPDQIIEVNGLRTTSPARSIFDIAIRLKKRQLTAVVDRALVRRLVSTKDLVDIVTSIGRRGRPGTAKMRDLLQDLSTAYVAPESELERRLLNLVTATDLPTPVPQMRVPWRSTVSGRVDIAFPESRTIVECDGRRWHTLAEAFERDRRRDNLAQAAGWRVLRFTWDDVTKRPSQTIRQIQAVVASAA